MDAATLARFEVKYVPDPMTGCWLWTAAENGRGYGVMGLSAPRRMALAHRLSYEHWVGSIPEKMFVLHHCDTPPCVNPAHLFVGTPSDNVHDMDAKGRRRIPPLPTHCPYGHPYDEVNTYRPPNSGNARQCRECKRRRWRETHPPGWAASRIKG